MSGLGAVRLVCNLHRAAGVAADVVPRSGASAGFKGDIRIHLLDGDPLVGEVKLRTNGSGFATLHRWLGDNDLLVVKQDREPPLVVRRRFGAALTPYWASKSRFLDTAVPPSLNALNANVGSETAAVTAQRLMKVALDPRRKCKIGRERVCSARGAYEPEDDETPDDDERDILHSEYPANHPAGEARTPPMTPLGEQRSSTSFAARTPEM